MAVAAQLFRLEKLDADLDRREKELAEIRRRQGRNVELEAAEARLDALRSEERQLSSEQRSMDSDLNALEAKIKRDNSRMFGGVVVDPRELASLEKELAHYQVQRDALEERLLTLMERIESMQDEIADLSRQVNEMRSAWEDDRQTLGADAETMADELAGMRAEREVLAASVDPPSLNLYQRLRVNSGHAVSNVSNGVCQWCRVNIPAKDVQHARAGSLVTCTNCARILYTGR